MGDVIDLYSKKKKKVRDDIIAGRINPFKVDDNWKIAPDSEIHADRLNRIKQSLEALNRLMKDIKESAKENEKSTEENKE